MDTPFVISASGLYSDNVFIMRHLSRFQNNTEKRASEGAAPSPANRQFAPPEKPSFRCAAGFGACGAFALLRAV
jgi:hypothetical protein